MAFEGLAEKLQAAFQKLNNRGKLTEKDVKDAMREVRMALLEADVNFLVVKDFVKRVTERAVGEEIFSTLNAGQTVIKIVREEMTALMGGTQAKLEFTGNPPTVILLIGLQGAGKTTLAGKLAGMLQKQGKKQKAEKQTAFLTRIRQDSAHSFSDLIDATTNGQLHGNYGHSRNYWTRPGNLQAEAFAHFFEASMGDQGKLELLANFFPTAFGIFSSMIDSIRPDNHVRVLSRER